MMKILLFLLYCLSAPPALAGELASTHADQQALSLTIYQNDLALVRDSRQVDLPSGPSRLAFTGISAQLRPETARLHGDAEIIVLAQQFDFDLLTPQSLLEAFVGQEIGVARINPASGAEQMQRATLLAVAEGRVVFRVGNRIETDGPLSPWRFVFDELPAGLRERPTLILEVEAAAGGERILELDYLSGGLSWRADYVATLAEGRDSLKLMAWATLNNTSGADYRDARVQLMAGEVQQVHEDRAAPQRLEMRAMAEPAVQEEAMFEYHLYTLERPLTLADQQTQQVVLFQAESVPVRKEYFVRAPAVYYRLIPEVQELQARTVLHFDNQKPDLGRPLPAGVVRVYQQDRAGTIQFVGENRIEHTPEGRELSLEVGSAFDITARRRQTDFNRLSREVTESAWEIEIHNARTEPVEVTVIETLPGDWQIMEENLPHFRETVHQVRWTVPVSAKDQAVLSYRVRVR